MYAIMHNKVTCAWAECLQEGDQLVVHGEIILEYCERHVARAIAREDRRRAQMRQPSGVTSGTSQRGR